jgi:adenosylcobinamide-phosphate guanylyltransferase
MCGGEGRRLEADCEKPLFPVAGRSMVDRVLDALVGAPGEGTRTVGAPETDPRAGDGRDRDGPGIDRVVAAVSPATPETADHLRGRSGVTVLETDGKGYVADLESALTAVTTPALTVAADLPLLAPGVVERVQCVHDHRGDGGGLVVRVPRSLKVQLGASVDEDVVVRDDGTAFLPAGINVVGTLAPTPETDDTMYTSYDARLAVNVNRPADVALAEALLCD